MLYTLMLSKFLMSYHLLPLNSLSTYSVKETEVGVLNIQGLREWPHYLVDIQTLSKT